jgi:hypothetical protein
MSNSVNDDLPTSAFETPTAVKPACCPWRSAVQTPLLLMAAAGLGFAGQQVWTGRADLDALLTGTAAVSHCCSSASEVTGCSASDELALTPTEGCPLSAAAESGCCLLQALAGLAEEEDVVSALAPENSTTTDL